MNLCLANPSFLTTTSNKHLMMESVC
jgi:hypothetical protein